MCLFVCMHIRNGEHSGAMRWGAVLCAMRLRNGQHNRINSHSLYLSSLALSTHCFIFLPFSFHLFLHRSFCILLSFCWFSHLCSTHFLAYYVCCAGVYCPLSTYNYYLPSWVFYFYSLSAILCLLIFTHCGWLSSATQNAP